MPGQLAKDAIQIHEVPLEVCRHCCTFNAKKHKCGRWATPDAPWCGKSRSQVSQEVKSIARYGNPRRS